MQDTQHSELERRIRKKVTRRARARLGLRWHALVFALVNLALFALNMMFTPLLPWFVWPLVGWGIALALHAFATLSGPSADEDAIEAQVQRELTRRATTVIR
jgi:hypothetical protein